MFRVWEKGQRVLLEVFSETSLQEIASSRPSGQIAASAAAGLSATDKH
jgi:hypothetical protein